MIKFLLRDRFDAESNYTQNIDEGYNFLVLVDINNKDITKNELLDKIQNYLNDIYFNENLVQVVDLKNYLDDLGLDYEIINLNDLDYVEY